MLSRSSPSSNNNKNNKERKRTSALAYVSIRQHTSAYVSIRQHSDWCLGHRATAKKEGGEKAGGKEQFGRRALPKKTFLIKSLDSNFSRLHCGWTQFSVFRVLVLLLCHPSSRRNVCVLLSYYYFMCPQLIVVCVFYYHFRKTWCGPYVVRSLKDLALHTGGRVCVEMKIICFIVDITFRDEPLATIYVSSYFSQCLLYRLDY